MSNKRVGSLHAQHNKSKKKKPQNHAHRHASQPINPNEYRFSKKDQELIDGITDYMVAMDTEKHFRHILARLPRKLVERMVANRQAHGGFAKDHADGQRRLRRAQKTSPALRALLKLAGGSPTRRPQKK